LLSAKKKARLIAGPKSSPRSSRDLEGATLVVDTTAGHEELPFVVAAVAKSESLAVDRSALVRHTDNTPSDETAVVVVATVEVHPQAFELHREVVGEGVLDTTAEHPADAVVVVVPGPKNPPVPTFEPATAAAGLMKKPLLLLLSSVKAKPPVA
jgi:hypothetical protein